MKDKLQPLPVTDPSCSVLTVDSSFHVSSCTVSAKACPNSSVFRDFIIRVRTKRNAISVFHRSAIVVQFCESDREELHNFTGVVFVCILHSLSGFPDRFRALVVEIRKIVAHPVQKVLCQRREYHSDDDHHPHLHGMKGYLLENIAVVSESIPHENVIKALHSGEVKVRKTVHLTPSHRVESISGSTYQIGFSLRRVSNTNYSNHQYLGQSPRHSLT
jgi:hypothetical protein